MSPDNNPSSAASSPVTDSEAPLLMRYRLDSGLRVVQPAAAFVASADNQTLFYWAKREFDLNRVQTILGLRARAGEESRLRGVDERGGVPYVGDAVDQDGLLILPLRPLLLRVSDYPSEKIVASFPVPDSGLCFRPGPHIPSPEGGHYTQLLLTDISGEPVASCYHNSWCDGEQQPYPSGRGFLMRIADEDWFALSDGCFRLKSDGPRRRPSDLASRLV